eukprot:TRINITY_DN269_c0_g1_i1.p1 TRINITY_DN269_c0_g1~~TRINITY_DN269_c0_g1_i1.p1  ORF type:complete len:211 (-),score=82.56 TRINITY_DN269_c0_g1_i1:119-751(-)
MARGEAVVSTQSTGAKEDQKNNTSESVELVSLDYEVNPTEMKEGSDADLNAIGVALLATKFLVQIMRSVKIVPSQLRRICCHVFTQVEAKFPQKGYQAVGAFMFLRFYNNAITVPESFGFIPEAPPQAIRRELLVIGKVLQNLANGMEFGKKEEFMIKFNSFLEESTPKLQAFYKELCSSSEEVSALVDDEQQVPDNVYGAALLLIGSAK